MMTGRFTILADGVMTPSFRNIATELIIEGPLHDHLWIKSPIHDSFTTLLRGIGINPTATPIWAGDDAIKWLIAKHHPVPRRLKKRDLTFIVQSIQAVLTASLEPRVDVILVPNTKAPFVFDGMTATLTSIAREFSVPILWEQS